MGQREQWATGISGPQGGGIHREEGATGRSGPQGGVDHREDLSTGRSESCKCWEFPKSRSHQTMGRTISTLYIYLGNPQRGNYLKSE